MSSIEVQSNNFSSSNILPKEAIITAAGSHLYRIGLSLFPNGRVKRSLLYNPVLIFILILVVFIRSVFLLLLSDEYEYLFPYLGDFYHYFNVRVHGNSVVALFCLFSLTSQLIHYYNYKNDIKPSYLKPFEMISGLVSPKSIGLTNEAEIYKMIKYSKTLFFAIEITSIMIVPLMGFLLFLIQFSSNKSILEIFLIGIPHSIVWYIFILYTSNITNWQIVYFWLTCYYMKYKIFSVNKNLVMNLKSSKIFPKYHSIDSIKTLNSLYLELSDYNSNWSKFLFLFWITFVGVSDSLLYLSIFGRMNLLIRILFIFTVIGFDIILLLTINFASSVNSEANKSYNLLNSLMICLSRRHSNKTLVLSKRLIKV